MNRLSQAVSAFKNRTFQDFSSPFLRSFTASMTVLAIAFLFCGFHYKMGDLNLVYLIFAFVVVSLYFLTNTSRIFFVLAIPMLLHGIVYDSFRYIPFHWLQPIHIFEPYHVDKLLFGVPVNGEVILFHEYLLRFSNKILNLIFGLVYFLHDPVVYILLVVFWRVRSVDLAERFSAAFLLMNLFAFTTYFFYPAAAPWYAAKFGFIQPLGPIQGNAAGLTQLGISQVASKIYSFNPVVFGAIPSMHAGFTMLSWIYSFYVSRKLAVVVGIYAMSMWFAALYLQHHYLIDILIGVLYAVAAWQLTENFLVGWVRKAYVFLFQFFIPNKPMAVEETFPAFETPSSLCLIEEKSKVS